MMQRPSAPVRWRPAAALLLLGLAGCVTTPVEDDPLQIRLDDLDRRLGQIERVAGGQNLINMSQRIDALQNELRQLRGRVEVLENANEGLRKQARDLHADLSQRLDALEGGGAVRRDPGGPGGAGTGGPGLVGPGAGGRAPIGPGPAGAAPEASGGSAASAATPARSGDTAEQRYGKAFDALKAANYPAAITGMRQFLSAYPDHDLADNAQYWLGEAHYVTREYEEAITAFARVLQRWPQSSKAPDALLKQGYAQFELKRLPAAKQTLGEVVARYPGTEAAKLAQERLRRIP